MSNENRGSEFRQLNYGTKPTGAQMQVIEVILNPDLMMRDFAKAYEGELYRRNSNLAERSGITADDLYDYFVGILAIHIEHDNVGAIKEWRRAKELYIPAWIQHTISMVGTYVDQIRGLKFVPRLLKDDKGADPMPYDLSRLLKISEQLAPFRLDGLKIMKDAFPRSPEGDPEVMSMIIAEQCVRSITPDAHPASSYVAAFLGFKLKEELAWVNLYRVKYDDFVLVHEMLLREEVLRQ